MVAGMLLFASSRAQMAGLPWAAGVAVLLALADAGQVALARSFTGAYNRFMAKVPLNGGNAPKAEEWLVLPAPTLGLRDAGQVLGALGSFSVWPFYGALLALVVAFHVQMAGSGGCCGEGKSARLLTSSATNMSSAAHGCSAGGGCGTTGGCGSGGCGASSGKGCGCGSAGADAAKTKSAQPVVRPAQSYPALSPQFTTPTQSTRPLPTPPQPVNGVIQLPNRGTKVPARPGQFPPQPGAAPVQPGTPVPPPSSGASVQPQLDAGGTPALQPAAPPAKVPDPAAPPPAGGLPDAGKPAVPPR